MKVDFSKLRTANIARQAEWPGNDKVDLGFRALEVADEAGEVLGAIKKLTRAQRGIAGSTLTLQDVADELADTAIALDLLAIELGFDTGERTLHPGDPLPVEELALMLDATIGELSGTIADRLREIRDEEEASGTEYKIWGQVGRSIFWLMCLAEALGVDLETAITAKFNQTSEKYGMATRP